VEAPLYGVDREVLVSSLEDLPISPDLWVFEASFLDELPPYGVGLGTLVASFEDLAVSPDLWALEASFEVDGEAPP